MSLMPVQRVKYLLLVMELHECKGLTETAIGSITAVEPLDLRNILLNMSAAKQAVSHHANGETFWRADKEWAKMHGGKFNVIMEKRPRETQV